jgi:hypothetical protein
MPLSVLQYKPGIVKDITEYSAGKNGPFWVDSNLVRFKNGFPAKIGGWLNEQINGLSTSGAITNTETTITGIARRMVYWRADTDGEDRLAVGTDNHLYIIENNSLYDITPLRDETNAATTTSEALDATETGIDVVSVAGFTAAGAVIIGTEIITYASISTLTLTGCSRGDDNGLGTSSATHDSGDAVTQVLINPITTADESTTVTITNTAHGALKGDWIVISGAAATGGVTADVLNSMAGHQITEIVNVNSYKIVVPDAATSTVSAGGGLTIVIKYLIGSAAALGAQSSDPALGWGVGGWGLEAWGTARSASESEVNLDNSSWNLSLWGEDLIATVRNGAIYYWDTSVGVTTRASLVSAETGSESVPSVARITTVSFPDRHFIAAGCQAYAVGGNGNVDDMLVRWSTQEDFTKFGPTSTNTAGDQRLQIGTKIVAMVAAREETIISTDEAIYGMTFTGGNFVFSFRLLATDAGAAGLNTMIGIDGDVYWMGKRNFFRYDGMVKEIPCSVQYYVFDRIQARYLDKVVVGHNKQFHEITWWYVSNDNTAGTVNPENDSYVTYNYAENSWSIGTMDRTVWSDSFGAKIVPFAFDPDGYLYNHETGTSANGSAMNSYIEASPRELTQDGSDLYMIDKVIPDVTMSTDTDLYLYMNSRKYPNAPETTKGPFTITTSTQKISTRSKGRQIALKFQSTGTDDAWTLGDFRVNVREDGMR